MSFIDADAQHEVFVMVRHRLGFLHLSGMLALCGLALLLAAPVAAGDPCSSVVDLPARTVGTDPQVKTAPCAFAPTVTRIPVGGTVTFFNGDGPAHLITGANQEWGSPDVQLSPNATVSYTFAKAGAYPYACALHPGMSGAIVVGDPETALAVTDETGNVAGAGVDTTVSDAATVASGAAGRPDLPVLAVGGALGLLAGVALMALVMRRRTPAAGRQHPLGSTD